MSIQDYSLDFSPIQKGLEAGQQMALNRDANKRANDANQRAGETHAVELQKGQMDLADRKKQDAALSDVYDTINKSVMVPDPNNPGQMMVDPNADYKKAFEQAAPSMLKFYAASHNPNGITNTATQIYAEHMLDKNREALAMHYLVKDNPVAAAPAFAEWSNKNSSPDKQVDPATAHYDPKMGVFMGDHVAPDGTRSQIALDAGDAAAMSIKTALDPRQAMATSVTANQAMGTEQRAAETQAYKRPGMALEANIAAAKQPQAGAIADAQTKTELLQPDKVQMGIQLQGAQASKELAQAGEAAQHGKLFDAQADFTTDQKAASYDQRAEQTKQKQESAVQDQIDKALGYNVKNLTPSQQQQRAVEGGAASAALSDPRNQQRGVKPMEAAAAARLVHSDPVKMQRATLDSLAVAPDASSVTVKQGGKNITIPLMDPAVGFKIMARQEAAKKRAGGIKGVSGH